MAEEICKLLEINTNLEYDNDDLDFVKIPILPSVYKELNFTFKDENIITLQDIEQYY